MNLNNTNKFITFIFFLVVNILFISCEENKAPLTKGLHFQGRDCILCHNSDLEKNKALVIAGTLFKNSSLANGEDLTTMCNEDLLINFLDLNLNIIHSSKISNSRGTKGKGNFFILNRDKNQVIKGTYIMQIKTSDNKTILAQSPTHNFNGTIIGLDDPQNRYSCNACHTHGGVQPPLSSNKCK